MYFKKLELLGFKSFAEKTTFYFEPGITAIVGPNGTGKSNISDSIRWVLGEQSEKALRSSKMEDVIFNGTEDMPSLNFAEVSLTFSNEKKILPIEYDEVTITRRLFRSGESEYLINKVPVRLKDILDLFYGTGIGAESYSLIEQGKVDRILSSKPEERRLIFEEAAGITKYKSDKKETLRKLEDTRNNLLRINDIISEVKRQIDSLEKQAEKAKKYKEIFEKLKYLEIKKAGIEIQRLNNEKEILNKKILDLESQVNSIEEKIEKDSLEFREMSKKAENLESELNSLKENIISCENKALNNNQIISLNKERTKELNLRISELEEDKKSILKRISEIKYSIEEKKENLKNLNKSLQEKRGQLTEKENLLDSLKDEIKKAQKEILESKEKIYEGLTEITPLKNQLNEIYRGLQELLARKKRLEIEREKVAEEKRLSEEKRNPILSQIDSLNNRLQEFSSLLSLNKNELEGQNSEVQIIDGKIEDLEKLRLEYISQKEFLKELKLKYEEISSKQRGLFLLKEAIDLPKIFIAKVDHTEEINESEKKIFSEFNFKIKCEIKSLYRDEPILEEKIKDIEKNLEEVFKEKERKNQEIQRIIENLRNIEACIRETEIEKVNLENQREQIEIETKKLDEESELLNLELTQTNKDLDNLKEKESRLKEEIKTKEDKIRELESIIEKNSEFITLNNQKKETALIISTQLKAEISSLEDKVISEAEKIKILEDSYSKELKDSEKREKDKVCILEKISELQELSKRLNIEIEILERTKEDFKKNLDLKENEYLELKNKIKLKESERFENNRIKEDLREQIHKFYLEIQDLEFKEKSIRERIQQIYKADVEEVRVEENFEDLSFEIENLRKRLDSFGEVSMGVIEESNELKSRYEFLIQQRNDLISAKEYLETAIKKIDHITKKMFCDTFKNIRLEFRNYFRYLFGGGDAQLFLLDESDPLESGIEIICRPPGKKLQNILLLSGGEKALVVISLLFAIFKVKPAAFCILDEVDAPLDESNTERFNQLLKDFSQNSQFIIITHNKTTITCADVMYGITMEKSGVSKVVSVKFKKEPAEVY